MKNLFFAAFATLFAASAYSQKAVVVLYDPFGIGANQGIALKSECDNFQLAFRGTESSRKVRIGAFQIDLNLIDGFILLDDCGCQVVEGTEICLKPNETICFEITHN